MKLNKFTPVILVAFCLAITIHARATCSVTINPNPASICQGSNVVLTAIGITSTIPLGYYWSTGQTTNTITAISAGTYSVTFSDLATCTSTASVVVTVNPLPTVVVTPSNHTICQSNCASWMTASGAVNYVWNPPTGCASTIGPVMICCPLTTTNYTVTGTDSNGCTNTTTTTITVIQTSFQVCFNLTPICYGTCANLCASGATTYTWSPSNCLSSSNVPNPIACCNVGVTTYTVTMVDANGCTAQGSTTVTVNPLPPAPSILCLGADTFVSSSNSSYAGYQWYFNGFPILGATDSSYVPTQHGIYVLTVIDANGCTSSAQTTCFALGLANDYHENSISIYPNPTSGSFLVSLNYGKRRQETLMLSIYDVFGEELRVIRIEKDQTIISRESLAEGIYFYKLTHNGDKIQSGKLMIE